MNNYTDYLYASRANELYLAHYGVIGQKCGVRRFQNDDGSLTNFGKRRFRKVEKYKSVVKRQEKVAEKMLRKDITSTEKNHIKDRCKIS